MYLLLKTSFALALPTIMSYVLQQHSIALSSGLCLATSICNHSVKGEHDIIKTIDIVTQHGFGIYYTIKAIVLIFVKGELIFFIPTIISLTIVSTYWLCIHYIPNTSNQLYKHVLMHIFGSIGICCYTLCSSYVAKN